MTAGVPLPRTSEYHTAACTTPSTGNSSCIASRIRITASIFGLLESA